MLCGFKFKLFKRKSKLDTQLDEFTKTHSIDQIHALQQKYQKLLTHTMINQLGSENYYCGVLNFLDDAEKRLCSLNTEAKIK